MFFLFTPRTRVFWNVSILLFALTSCKEDIYLDGTKDINFLSWKVSLKEEVATRGTPISSASDEAFSSFGIFGFHTEEDYASTTNPTSAFLPNLEVSKVDNNDWELPETRYWPQNGVVTFFAYYPYTTGNNNSNGLGVADLQTDVAAVYYKTPENVADQPDLMVAKTQFNLSRSTVNLVFSHALACIGFSVIGEGTTIEYIGISGISTSGSLSLYYTEEELYWNNVSAPSDSLFKIGLINDAQSSTTGTNIMATNGYLMLIPQTLTDNAKLIVKFENEDAKEVSLTSSGITSWKAGYKYNYELNEGSYIFDVTVDSDSCTYAGGDFKFTITSEYISGSSTKGLGWTAEINYEDGTNWLSGDLSDNTGGADIIKTLAASIAPGTTTNAADEKLLNATEVSMKNLSLSSNTTYSTANSYIVNAPGTYKFLCSVMGNAIDKGSSETSPNNWISLPADNVFQNYKGDNLSNISQLTIDLTDAKAELLWQDAPGLISNIAVDGNYITFSVNRSTIKQGNAVIGILNSGDSIMWSWHIWVTAYIKGDGDITSGQFTYMRYDLGTCLADTFIYPERMASIVFTQNNTGKKDTIQLKQSADNLITNVNNPYFQWGRKDPFIGSNGVLSSGSTTQYENKQSFGSRTFTTSDAGNGVEFYQSILNPNYFFFSTNSTYNYRWNLVENDLLWGQNKSVYDPCPVGYKVSDIYTLGQLTWSVTDGENMWKGTYAEINVGTAYVYYQYATGGRLNTTGVIFDYNSIAYTWSCDESSSGYTFYISSIMESSNGGVMIYAGTSQKVDDNYVQQNMTNEPQYRWKGSSYGLSVRPVYIGE